MAPRFLAWEPRRVAEFAAGNPLPWYRANDVAVVDTRRGTVASRITAGTLPSGIVLVDSG